MSLSIYNDKNKDNSERDPVSSFDYMKNKEKNGISLYTHIQALLDLFIFQNPMKPVTHFEYYSEHLKMHYIQLQKHPEIHFLYNIEKNVIDQTIDIYKQSWDSRFNKRNEQSILEEINYFYGEDVLKYEFEDKYNDDEKNIANEIVVQNLSEINYMLNKAGCGMTIDEANLIGMTMKQMSSLGKMKNIRFWGKIFGLKHNYYILECEWLDEELENKLGMLNNKMKSTNVLHNHKNRYEDEEEFDLEGNILDEKSDADLQVQDENDNNSSVFTMQEEINERSKFESHIKPDGSETSKTAGVPLEDLNEDDDFVNEMFGFGANKKSYFVTNELNNEWVELPPLKSHHFIQSHNIKRYFVGDLESPIESYPLFQGMEKHYLRAQIARITSATHISPRNYFVLDNNKKSKKWRNLNDFQSKVISKKGVHDCIINENFKPPPLYALLEPENWVHHTPLISDEGVTKAWTKLKMSEKHKNKANEQVAEEHEEDVAEATGDVDESPDILATLVGDARTNDESTSFWKFEITNPFDHQTTYISAKSNRWPGAFAVARDNVSDCTYSGWGHERIGYHRGFAVFGPDLVVRVSSEYPDGARETTETDDPSRADELSAYAEVKMAKARRREKIAWSAGRTTYYDASLAVDEDEKLIKQYIYE